MTFPLETDAILATHSVVRVPRSHGPVQTWMSPAIRAFVDAATGTVVLLWACTVLAGARPQSALMSWQPQAVAGTVSPVAPWHSMRPVGASALKSMGGVWISLRPGVRRVRLGWLAATACFLGTLYVSTVSTRWWRALCANVTRMAHNLLSARLSKRLANQHIEEHRRLGV